MTDRRRKIEEKENKVNVILKTGEPAMDFVDCQHETRAGETAMNFVDCQHETRAEETTALTAINYTITNGYVFSYLKIKKKRTTIS